MQRRGHSDVRLLSTKMAYFKQALDEAIDDAGGDDRCATRRPVTALYGTRSSKPTRKKAFDEDRGLDPLKAKFPTICVNGVRRSGERTRASILFIRTYGGAHKYFLPVAENNKGVCDWVWASRVWLLAG